MTAIQADPSSFDEASDAPATDLTAADVAWDLEPLVHGDGRRGVDHLLDDADALADTLAASHGQVDLFDAAELDRFMRELADLYELLGLAGSYASLRFAVDTADSEVAALMQRVQERSTAINTKLLFFELEWSALDDDHAERLLDDHALTWCAHHLRSVRRYRDHLLTEPEERILTEKSQTGRSAWSRLFSELSSAITVEIPDVDAEGGARTEKLEGALSLLADPDRDVRRAAAEAVTAGLAPGLRTRAFVFNTLLLDKSVDDRLRSYPTWLTSRNLSNEATDESVAALVESVKDRYDIPQRWYRLKAQILGIDRLADYDRMASVAESEARIGWSAAKEVVLDSYASFSPDMAEIAHRFFDERWIDAPVRPAKRPGAFCAYTVPSHHPYVMLNWTGRRRDVLTLAHELGHGLHAYLARDQGVFHQGTPLTLAETASVFGETVTFGRLLDATDDPGERLALLAESIEGAIATVFRQTAMNQFEAAVHTSRRTDGEVSVDRFGELWAETQAEMLGDAVEITEGYRTWWSYIPHFIGTPGYVYAYAYGQLLALSVYARFTEQGGDFVPRYLHLLSSGGSMPPEELGRIVGCDLADPGFWGSGLDIVESQLEAAEAAAHEAGRL
jgi:oligoendopeptidase F